MSVISVSYFSCFDCKTVFPVPERVLGGEGYFFNCNFCARPISLRNIHKTQDMEILEVFGCTYGGKESDPDANHIKLKTSSLEKGNLEVDSWISDSVSKANVELATYQDDIESSVVEGSASKWEIKKKGGKTLRFDFFSEVRKAVLEGKIVAGDSIIPFEGAKHKIEDYPGTADLFGNQFSKDQIGFREIPSWEPISKSNRRNYEGVIYALLVIFIGVGTYLLYPRVIHYWKTKQGEKIVTTLSETPTMVQVGSLEELKKNLKLVLMSPEILALSPLSEKIGVAVGKNPLNTDLISLYAQSLTEIGALNGSRQLLADAEKLSFYLKFLEPDSANTTLAHARYLWRSGQLQEAADLLSRLITYDEDAAFVLGKIYLDLGDLQKSFIYFSDAAQKNPQNPLHLTYLSEISQKQRKFPEAAAFTKKAIELDPKNEAYQTKLLAIYSEAQDLQSLEDYYRERIGKNIDVENNLFKLTTLLFDQKKLPETLREATRFLSLFPQSSQKEGITAIHKNVEDLLKPAPAEETPPPSDAPVRRRRRRIE